MSIDGNASMRKHDKDRPSMCPGHVNQRIRKSPPFSLPMITGKYPGYAHLLSQAFAQLDGLPDFADDSKIAVLSDFGGEHKTAGFNTYSFLIIAYNKIGPFETKVRELREKHRLLRPYSEFKFKDLTYGPRSRALPELLEIVDHFLHGVLITVAIEKGVGSVFGPDRQEAHSKIEQELAKLGFGQWKGATAEKVLRICHAAAQCVALTTHDGQRLLWYCDLDSINEDASTRTFEHTQQIFASVLRMYCSHEFEILGFGKAFQEKTHLDDLLSIPDLAAGIVQDLLQGHQSGIEIPGGKEKESLLRWIATQGHFLSKVVIQIVRTSMGELGSGLVHLAPVEHAEL